MSLKYSYDAFNKGLFTIILSVIRCSQFTSIFPTPALSHQAAIPVQIVQLDDCAADAIAPAILYSEGAYVANSNTGKFYYAGCRYVNMMSKNHKVFYDNRDEAINAGFVRVRFVGRKVDAI